LNKSATSCCSIKPRLPSTTKNLSANRRAKRRAPQGSRGQAEADLVEAYAERGCGRIVDPKLVRRLANIEVSLARGHDAYARVGVSMTVWSNAFARANARTASIFGLCRRRS
jgi:hypothetical protein